MGAYASICIVYGVAIDIEASALDWWDLPEEGEVTGMGVGLYGGFKNQHLIISSTLESLEPSDVKAVQPYQAASDPYLTWDAMLVATAEDLKVPIVGQPGWLFSFDES
jgi:hypothetical protein